MNGRLPFVAHREAAVAVEPRQRPLDHPAMLAQPLARLDAPPRDTGCDAALAASQPTKGVIVAFVGMQLGGAATRPTALPTHGRDGIQGCFQHLTVVDIGRRKRHRERDTASVDHQMALRARFAAIRWIRPGLLAPFLAATLAESSTARDQSSLSASCRRPSSSWCSRSQTPACCQSRTRRQQVMPLPQPSSWGSISHGIPLFRTKTMPVSAARSLRRGRPPFGLAGSLGSSGSTTAQSSSLTSGLLMPPVYH